MKKQVLRYRQSGLAIIMLLLSASLAFGQTTSFNFQGRLVDSGTPANGNYDFLFLLYDAVSGGTQQGTTQNLTNITVTNGIFTVQLDFGATFPGANRFLEIRVKPAGGPTYTTLSPRQQINSTPYTIKSLNATTADGLSVSCVNCVTSSQIQSVQGSQVTGTIPVASIPAGSSNYIQNTTSPQAPSNFNITGSGTVGGQLSATAVNATTQYNLGGSRILGNSGSFNLFAGVNAGVANTTGAENAFFGVNAGAANTSGLRNSFFGRYAGSGNTTGNGNSFFGYAAGDANTTGASNAFFGNFAGASNSASNNAFFGEGAGISNTTGTFNSFFGSGAGSSNTTASNNSFFGMNTGFFNTGANNSFFGKNAGFSNTASNIAFFGYNAGLNNTTGCCNAFFGANAGESNTTGNENSFYGSSAGKANTTGVENSFFGEQAGKSNTTGYQNAFFGALAGFSNETGQLNAFFGDRAGLSNTTGYQNAFFGLGAGNSNTTENGNTFIGAYAEGVAGVTNSTAIGWHAKVTQSNSLVLGSINGVNLADADTNVGIGTTSPVARLHIVTSSTNVTDNTARFSAPNIGPHLSHIHYGTDGTWFIRSANSTGRVILQDTGGNVGIGTSSPADKLHVTGDIRVGTGTTGCVKDADGTLIAGVCSSDRRFKRNITPFPNLLDKVVKLQPVNFFWRSSQFPQYHFGTSQSYGLIAQEVEAVLPELISTDEQGFKAVNYSKLPLLAIQAIKEQQTQITQQQLQIRKQQGEIKQLKQLICADHPRATVCRQRR